MEGTRRPGERRVARAPVRGQAGREVGRRAEHGPPGASRLLGLQRLAGNAAVTRLINSHREPVPGVPARTVQRQPGPGGTKTFEQAADYTNAMKYVDDFYEGTRDLLELEREIRSVAIEAYEEYSKLPEPPSLGRELTLTIFSGIFGLVPGWDIVKKGMTMGMFAYDLHGLKRDLERSGPIPGLTVEDERAAGPGAATTKRAGGLVGAAKQTWGLGKDIVTKTLDVIEKQGLARTAEKLAAELTAHGIRSVTDWADGIALAREQEMKVTEWLKEASKDPAKRGGLEAAVRRRLGPIPDFGKAKDRIPQAEKEYELAYWKAHFGGEKGTASLVTTTVSWSGHEAEPFSYRKIEGMTSPMRKRVAHLAGLPEGPLDDVAIARVLGLRQTQKQERRGFSGYKQ